MQFYDVTVPQLTHTLTNVDRWMKKAAEHADADKLLTARLAPDQYPFTRQVQVACDNAKMIAGRLAGKEWPAHPDTETTFAQLLARTAAVRDYLATLTPDDFSGASERQIRLPWMGPSQHMTAQDYVVQFALPNFYFHCVTAYSILRHHGVQLGKMDYIGPITIKS